MAIWVQNVENTGFVPEAPVSDCRQRTVQTAFGLFSTLPCRRQCDHSRGCSSKCELGLSVSRGGGPSEIKSHYNQMGHIATRWVTLQPGGFLAAPENTMKSTLSLLRSIGRESENKFATLWSNGGFQNAAGCNVTDVTPPESNPALGNIARITRKHS